MFLHAETAIARKRSKFRNCRPHDVQALDRNSRVAPYSVSVELEVKIGR